jgi:protein-tyrosine-phosphatase/tRNA A37 threonylcarbamoyladenosine synthetase subunit TsaC/SUA5/YrdC
MFRLTYDSARKDAAAARRVGEILAGGGVVVFPTETVYGIGALASSVAGVAKLRLLKGLRDDVGLALHLGSQEAALARLQGQHPGVLRLARKVFPGPVSLSFSDATGLMRVPDDAAAQWVIQAAGGPFVATSAGSGDPEELVGMWEGKADVFVGNGRARFGKPSTLVEVQVNGEGRPAGFRVAREGVYDARYMSKFLKFTLLLVCSGNTCRSPMAAGLARSIVARKLGVNESQLEARGVKIISAGTMASAGYTASENAVEVMKGRGIDISRHRSSPVTHEMVNEADVILCMTQGHLNQVLRMGGSAKEKTLLLDEAQIDDPYGGPVEAYEQAARQIEPALRFHLVKEGLA